MNVEQYICFAQSSNNRVMETHTTSNTQHWQDKAAGAAH